MASTRSPENIVIVGGGIVGSCSAYYLAHHPSFDPARTKITLLEASQIAGGASGKAGGLLALWAYPSCIVPLSYGLHKELAERHGGEKRWGYRRVHCGEIDCVGQPLPGGTCRALQSLKNGDVKDTATAGAVDEDGNAVAADQSQKRRVSLEKRNDRALSDLRAKGMPGELDWVELESVRGYEEMGTPDVTAQVHPYLFTTAIAELAKEKGVEIVFGKVTSINTETLQTDARGNGRQEKITSVTYTPKDSHDNRPQTIPADTVILSAGPWSASVWPSAPIAALRAHSVTIRPSKPVSAYALFTSIAIPSSDGGGKGHKKRSEVVSPEIYARPNNEVYACGEGDTLVELPSLSSEVAVDESRCEDIVRHVSTISAELRDGVVTARQACYLPRVDRTAAHLSGEEAAGGGGPIIGASSVVDGLVYATGHWCWGIQNAPGTGKLVSEIVFDGVAKSARIRSLEPERFKI